jgi:hypothetical protein
MAKDVTVTGETETELEVTLQANRSVIEQCYSQDSFNITLHCNIQEQSSNATVKVKRTWNRTQTPGLSKDSSRLSIMTSFMPTKLLSIIGILPRKVFSFANLRWATPTFASMTLAPKLDWSLFCRFFVP